MKTPILSISKKDFDIQFFRGTGPGGQNRNKVETCVRLTHRASGAVTTGTEERSQYLNKVIAFKKMTNDKKFKTWLKIETARRLGTYPTEKEMNQQVDESMKESNLKIEYGGSWDEGVSRR